MSFQVEHYQSFIKALKPLNTIVVNFKKDHIAVHMLDTANTTWVNLKYMVDTGIDQLFATDVNKLNCTKLDVVDIKLNGNKLIIKSGKWTDEVTALALHDSLTSKNRDDYTTKWPCATIDMSAEDLTTLVDNINSKLKYDFVIKDGTFSIINTDKENGGHFDTPYECTNNYISRFHGDILVEILHNTKYFNGCQILLGNDAPLFIKYTCEWMTVEYMLAAINREVDGD